MQKKIILSVLLGLLVIGAINSQVTYPKFGSGLQVNAADSSFYLKLGFRFQSLYTSEWNLGDDDFSNLEDHRSAMLIRRSRLKMDGWAINPKFKYKAELALSNRDNGGGNSSNFNNAANIILDAQVEWNFYENLSIWAGQGKFPGNRERIISSGNLQFVDRSRLNSRFTLDRDVGVMLKYHHTLGEKFILKETIAIGSGEGKNITSGNKGGTATTFKIEALPFGNFQSSGEYVGSADKKEQTPKLAVALAYDTNVDAGRERGRTGSFIVNPNGDFVGKTVNSLYADLMFKYKGLSVMVEYANVETKDGDPNVIVGGNTIGTYYTGSATNFAVGQFIGNDWELAARWTDVNPDLGVANQETQYTFGISKFVVGHKLKVQSDITYRSIDGSDDDLFIRMQMDFHF